jgi:hypothetical protein
MLFLVDHFRIELFNQLHDIFSEPVVLDADVVHKIKDSGGLLLVLFEVNPVFLIWLNEALSHKVLLVEFDFVGDDIQYLSIFFIRSKERWHPDAVLVCNRVCFWLHFC